MVDNRQGISTTRRFAVLADAEMSERQREMVAQFKGFSLNGMRGPFNMMLRSPEAAERFQALGKYLRFDTGIDNRLVELMVLVHARIWSDQYEWMLHAPRAAEAGLSDDVVESVKSGRVPDGLSIEERAVFDYVLELELTKTVSDMTFNKAAAVLGEKMVTDLVFMIGQYITISMILAVLKEGQDLDILPPCSNPFAGYSASAE
ncbi:MAG: carboxymuconolactone decarboxylase family protein [Gammaproteobacteria bacterium]|nr:carboxymuconolactone decarboxylase family protein [Gammaproteobacteria bacterium]